MDARQEEEMDVLPRKQRKNKRHTSLDSVCETGSAISNIR